MHFGATGVFDVLEGYEHGLHKQTQYSDHICEQSQGIGWSCCDTQTSALVNFIVHSMSHALMMCIV